MEDRKPVIPNYKIFAFVGFVCAAIMTSLFVYHMSNKQKAALVQNVQQGNSSLMFATSRDIKPFQLVNADGSKFNNLNLRGHWTLMFFGFTHCSSICPVTLDMLAKAYPELHKAIPDLQVVLVSLDPERDDKKTLLTYTHKFNPQFVGVSGKIEEIRKLQAQLGIYSARDDQQKGMNYQLQHTSSIMLLDPQGNWAGMFKFGMKPGEFVREVVAVSSRVNEVNRGISG